MTLKERILEDIKKYMKEKNQVSLDTVRNIKSDVKNAEIEAMKELDDAGVVKIVQTNIKKRKDSAEIYTKANRQELADKELAEIKVLESYLPEQLAEEELIKIVKETLEELDDTMKKNFGAVMKKVMPKVAGKAEGKKISDVINGLLK